VTCGTDFTGLLNETEGRLFTFGNGEAGQLGHGERGLCLEPSVVPLDNVKEVAAGGAHMLALTSTPSSPLSPTCARAMSDGHTHTHHRTHRCTHRGRAGVELGLG
jgi:alpha-tubulin suppressor-like RCC1 family protein